MFLVINVFGIPGSGKSFFAELLAQRIRSLQGWNVTRISFDSYEDCRDTWDENSFTLTRRRGMAALSAALKGSNETENCGVIIIDDIMYLHSMRREVYRLARDFGVLTLSVWINTDPKVAYERNTVRTHEMRVTEHSFENIRHAFEEPDKRYVAEKHNLDVDGSSEESAEKGCQLVLQHLLSPYLLKEPFVVQKSDEGANIDVRSLIHDSDNCIRKLISRITSTLLITEGFLKDDVKLVAKLLNRFKAEALESIRSTIRSDCKNGTVANDSFRALFLTKVLDFLNHGDGGSQWKTSLAYITQSLLHNSDNT